ncbi:hypothetical protein B0H11DRAFT_1905286 [Mycena galericulata]|nr:hypothetical protein B0H11DRAFT_1905286 [Mycena galericulata]
MVCRSSADHLQMKSSTDGTRGCWRATATSLPRISTLMCGVALTRDGNDRLAPRRCALHARDGAQVPWACPWRHRRCGGDEAHTCGRARSRVGRVREGTGSGVRVRLGVCGGSAGWAEAWRDVLGEAKEEEGVAGAPYAPRPPRRMGSLLVCIVARARARTGRYGAAREGTHAYVESRDIVGGNGGEYRLTDLMAWICDGWVLFFATLREGKQQHLPLLPDGGVAAACWGDSDVNGESRKRVGGVGILCVGAGGGAGGAGGWRARKEAAAAGAKGRSRSRLRSWRRTLNSGFGDIIGVAPVSRIVSTCAGTASLRSTRRTTARGAWTCWRWCWSPSVSREWMWRRRWSAGGGDEVGASVGVVCVFGGRGYESRWPSGGGGHRDGGERRERTFLIRCATPGTEHPLAYAGVNRPGWRLMMARYGESINQDSGFGPYWLGGVHLNAKGLG